MNRKSVSEPAKVKVPRMQSVLLPMALALFALTACDRRDPPVEPVTSSPPPNTAAPTAQTPTPPAADMTDPAKGPAQSSDSKEQTKDK